MKAFPAPARDVGQLPNPVDVSQSAMRFARGCFPTGGAIRLLIIVVSTHLNTADDCAAADLLRCLSGGFAFLRVKGDSFCGQ